MKKLSLSIALAIFCLSFLCAGYSVSLDTGITNISGGEYGFGLGMFPLGTSYVFTKDFQMIPDYEHQAYLEFYSRFAFSNNRFGNYELFSGKPGWYTRPGDREETGSENWSSGTYFNPNSTLELFVQQPFGTNPISGDGPLMTLRLGFDTRYSVALERLGMSRGESNPVFIDNSGDARPPFGPGSQIQAFPWLQDSRISLNSYLFLSSFWYLYQKTGFNTRDGVYIDLTLEYGPSWLGNTISQCYSSSNYFKPSITVDERLTLLNSEQKNGWNWMSLYIGHSNTLSYTFGDIIPENKIPSDRLRGCFNDSLWLYFTGPQFLAGDCYTYIELKLSNNFYFGTVANEVTQEITAFENQSDVSACFHLRFFGFVHFQYTFGYNMARGIHASNPSWHQDAALSFYVSI